MPVRANFRSSFAVRFSYLLLTQLYSFTVTLGNNFFITTIDQGSPWHNGYSFLIELLLTNQAGGIRSPYLLNTIFRAAVN